MFAIKCHKGTNHLYDGLPYQHHLKMVVEVGETFIGIIPEEDRADVICGLWVHDLIEDARITKNDLKAATNEVIAELGYALTNEKGRTRSERANAKYYKGIRQTKHAVFCKLCDRIANMEYSLSKGSNSNMFVKYKKENDKFIYELVRPDKWHAKLGTWLLTLVKGKKYSTDLLVTFNPYSVLFLHLKNICNEN